MGTVCTLPFRPPPSLDLSDRVQWLTHLPDVLARRLNAFTLERNPGASVPAEIDLSTAVHTSLFTGADAGEGLDLDGNFIFAVDVGGPGGQRVGSVLFMADASTAGVSVVAQNVIPVWGDPINFGESPADDGLESVMAGIRWSASPTPVIVSLEGLTRSANYRLQLMFHEECCSRGFDLFVDDVRIVERYSPQVEQVRTHTHPSPTRQG